MPPPRDTDMIKKAYERVLFDPLPLQGSARTLLAQQLLYYVQFLMAELSVLVPRIQGWRRRTAEHLLTRTPNILKEGATLHDLGTQCRALLTLIEHFGELDDAPVDLSDEPPYGY